MNEPNRYHNVGVQKSSVAYDPATDPQTGELETRTLPCGCDLQYGPGATVCDSPVHDSWRMVFA